MIPSHLLPLLAADAHPIARAYLRSGAPGQATPSIEADYVAAIVIGAIGPIAITWGSRLRPAGISLTLQAVFCHGTPQVTFQPTGKHKYPTKTINRVVKGQCELADLLLVIDDTTGDPNQKKIAARRAALIQAKKLKSATSTRVALSGNELAQLDLLENWPAFEFASPGYTSGSRDFVAGAAPGVPATSGSYGVIDQYQVPPDWDQVPPAPPIQIPGVEFGTFLAGLADGGAAASGRAATPGGTDHWSSTIDELLSKTGVASLNLKSFHALPNPPARGISHMTYFHSGPSPGLLQSVAWVMDSGGQGRDDPPGEARDADDPQGISTIRLIVSRDDGLPG